MKIIDHGGPAFPSHANDTVSPDGGMTLRDYFAAKALPELMSADMAVVLSVREQTGMKPSDLARGAYEFADAMIAERDK